MSRLVHASTFDTPGLETPNASLSGGNQQKCMIARSLNARMRDPSRSTSRRAASTSAPSTRFTSSSPTSPTSERAAIVMVSSELPEILGISDRIVVMRDGRVAGRFERGEASEETLMAAAVGAARACG